MEIRQTQQAIDALLNECAERIDTGRGNISYAEGIVDGINWLLGHTDRPY